MSDQPPTQIEPAIPAADIHAGSGEQLRRPSVEVQRRHLQFYRRLSNPCCCPLQDGVMWIAVLEAIFYCIGIGITAYWYSNVIQYSNKPINPNETKVKRNRYRDEAFYHYQKKRHMDVESTNKLIALMAIFQIAIFVVNVVLSFALFVATVKRVGVIGKVWIWGLVITTTCRIIIMLVCPISEFELTLISFLFEMYYMWCVSCFVTECKLFPNGVEYYSDVFLPWIQPIDALYAAGYGGYQLVELPPAPYFGLRTAQKQRRDTRIRRRTSPPPEFAPRRQTTHEDDDELFSSLRPSINPKRESDDNNKQRLNKLKFIKDQMQIV